jgi:hypothetical protein
MRARVLGGAASRGRPTAFACGALLVACLAILAGCGTTEAPLSSATLEGSPEPLRITLVGDSIMRELSAPLEAALQQESTDVDFALIPAIATPTLDTDIARLVASHDPDVVVVLVGTWEGVAVDTRVDGWEERYALNVLDPFIAAMAHASVDVVWLGYPPFPVSPEELRHVQLNQVYSDLPARFAWVSFVDAGAAVAGPDRTYQETLELPTLDLPGEGVVPLRQTDGRHLCPAGATLMAQAVVEHLQDRFHVVPVGGWQDAPWSTDPSSFEHPSQCPGDFPADAVGAGDVTTTTAAATATTAAAG